MKKKSITVGLGQLLIEGGEPKRNLLRATTLIAEARSKRCDLIVLPECLDLGWTHPSAKHEALPIPGPYSEQLCDIARQHAIYICAGLTERTGGKTYNTALLVNNEGEILLTYRKINLLMVEQEFYAVGQALSVVQTPFGIIGVDICADNYLNALHIGHTLARMGAQIILSPSSWTCDYSMTEMGNPYGKKWEKPYTILARLYNLVVVSATSVGVIVGGPYQGKKSVGCSLVVGPKGVLTRGPYNEVASHLTVTTFHVPPPHEKGTAIGEMLARRGYQSDVLQESFYEETS